ncbi:MAG: response regulator [Candidatus Nitrohelix vancouverensis]|uniref:Sensory/regulatory protein RpfC n=1 Tax=Candidatus Nitrohelix vancouverensis TaxID=2705534 RepID=A0A7T0C4C3_9BACT|nr:MAG: response regulator [Candidatus Nitrohelix vancouverensis]
MNQPIQILAVQNSSAQAIILTNILEKGGYKVRVLNDGQEALDSIIKAPPDLVITDIHTPGLDGFELCASVKDNPATKNLPIIIVTSLTGIDNLLKCLSSGTDYFFTKPYNSQSILPRVKMVLSTQDSKEDKRTTARPFEFEYADKKHSVVSDRRKILNLLLSTYEGAVNQNKELLAAQEALKKTNAELAIQIEEAARARESANLANQSKSIFLANMSHEIRTPMNAILGFAQILKRNASLSPEQKGQLNTIMESGNHLLLLINDILDISKIESGKTELSENDFDLQKLVASIVPMIQMKCEEKGLQWNIEGLGEDPIPVHADETKMRQILINLLGNASKFTDAGSVTLRMVEVESKSDTILAYRFEVIDTGAGMTAETQKKLFQPFQQGDEGIKKGGTGLGLSITKKQIEMMGGELSLESEAGKGARFYFTLQIKKALQTIDAPKTKLTISKVLDSYKVTALVVDDNELNRKVLDIFLRNYGIETIIAVNGQEAIDRYREHRPDLVFMDIHMPVMDGIEATKIIMDEFSADDPKIVCVTTSVFSDLRANYKESGFKYFILKPFSAEILSECLVEILDVEFDFAQDKNEEGEQGTPGLGSFDSASISLPESLLGRMNDALTTYSVTELEKCLEEIKQTGETGARLADALDKHVKEYNFDDIKKFLTRIKTTS